MSPRLLACAMIAAAPALSYADGIETLGTPSIPIADANVLVTGGIGLIEQPGYFEIEVPEEYEILQVLLYWAGRSNPKPDALQGGTLNLNGIDIIGTSIGGEIYPQDGVVYRTDITDLGLVTNGLNAFTAQGLNFTWNGEPQGLGCSIVVLCSDGTNDTVQILDGRDYAYIPHNHNMVAQTFTFAPADIERTFYLNMLAGDVSWFDGQIRYNRLDITMDGVTESLLDPFYSEDGGKWDDALFEIIVPAGVSEITIQPFSEYRGHLPPSSLVWAFAALQIDEIEPPVTACPLSPGYWKTHWYGNKADSTWDLLADGVYTEFFDTGKTWLEALSDAPRGSAYWILARQFVATQLNLLAGSDPEPIEETVEAALELLEEHASAPWRMGATDSAYALWYAWNLDEYNNGKLTDCDEDEVVVEEPCDDDKDWRDCKKDDWKKDCKPDYRKKSYSKKDCRNDSWKKSSSKKSYNCYGKSYNSKQSSKKVSKRSKGRC